MRRGWSHQPGGCCLRAISQQRSKAVKPQNTRWLNKLLSHMNYATSLYTPGNYLQVLHHLKCLLKHHECLWLIHVFWSNFRIWELIERVVFIKWVREDHVSHNTDFLKFSLKNIAAFLRKSELLHEWQRSPQLMRAMIWLNFQGGFTIAYVNYFINIYLGVKTLTTIVISSASSYKVNSFKRYHAQKKTPYRL